MRIRLQNTPKYTILTYEYPAPSLVSNLEQHSKGATLPAVLLKQDGTAVEVSFDTTPRLKEVNRIVGCDAHENITFAGQWEDVVDEGDSVLLILRGKAEDLNLPANKNKLQPPFHEAEIPGDILLQRSDEEGNGVCFLLPALPDILALVPRAAFHVLHAVHSLIPSFL